MRKFQKEQDKKKILFVCFVLVLGICIYVISRSYAKYEVKEDLKIIEGQVKIDMRGTLRKPEIDRFDDTYEAFWSYKNYITKVVFENELREHTEDEVTEEIKALNPTLDGTETLVKALDDVSADQDEARPVKAYLVANGEEAGWQSGYTLYIQSNGGVKANPDSHSLFNNFTNLKSIENIEYFDTSNVTDMSSMFWGCDNLSSLDLSHFDTSKVMNMNMMFYLCGNLSTLNVSGWDTSHVTDMGYMFGGCEQMSALDTSSWTANEVTNMYRMFSDCANLIKIDFSNFGTSLVQNMDSMFDNCTNLQEVNFGNLDTSHVTTMYGMFWSCESLTTLDLSHFDTCQVTDMIRMFSGCKNLSSLELSHFDTRSVTDMRWMFENCSNLKTITYGANFVHNSTCNTLDMFENCTANKPQGASWEDVNDWD